MISKYRGRALECYFEDLILNLNKLSCPIIGIRLEVKKGGFKTYLKRQPCDFVIDTGKTVWYLDTKESQKTTWYPTQAPAHQVEYFKKAQAMGRRAGFIVWFYEVDPAMINLRFIESFNIAVGINSGSKFDWSILLE